LFLATLVAVVGMAPVARAPGETELDPRLAPLRLAKLSASHFGVPYGHDAAVHPRRLDCQTYIEQVMAEALSPSPAEFERTLNRIRYRNGVVRMEERLVYVIPDWLRGDWPARDVTAAIAGDRSASMTKVIDRARFFGVLSLAHRGGYVAREQVNTPYIPRAAAAGLDYPDGSIAIFVQQRAGIVAGHCGFLFRRNGTTVLRHASQTRGAVIQEPLADYLARMPSYFLGLKVLQPDGSRWEGP
jgi:hypothetical protein